MNQRKREDSDGWLFPEIEAAGASQSRTKVLSQWFGRLRLNALGQEDYELFGKDMHSFRHSVADHLRAATDSDEKRFAIQGWIGNKGKKNAGYDYGKGFPLAELKRLVDTISYEGFDPSFLYPKDLHTSANQ